MNLSNHSNENMENIRKIEDIIDIQKANGNFKGRQVAFNLPVETESTISANLAKSLETGLSETKSDSSKKKLKKLRSKSHKSPLPDVISWPSDSDITVLRMKLFLTSSDLKDKVGTVIPGDGLHHPDSSSMVNLATLIRQSQPTSKHSLSMEEYLLPLTSWERQDQQAETQEPILEDKESIDYVEQFNCNRDMYDAMCTQSHQEIDEKYSSKDSCTNSKTNKKSKMARFLRLYFCPCCTCLYKLEKMSDEPSFDERRYFSKRKEL